MLAITVVVCELLLLSTISHMTSDTCVHVGLNVILRKTRCIDSLNTFDQCLVFDWTLLKTVTLSIIYLLAYLYVHIIDKLSFRLAFHF